MLQEPAGPWLGARSDRDLTGCGDWRCGELRGLGLHEAALRHYVSILLQVPCQNIIRARPLTVPAAQLLRYTFTRSRHVPRLARAVAGGGRRRSAGAAAHSGFPGRMYAEAVRLRRCEMVTDLCSRIRRGRPHLYIQWEAAE